MLSAAVIFYAYCAVMLTASVIHAIRRPKPPRRSNPPTQE